MAPPYCCCVVSPGIMRAHGVLPLTAVDCTTSPLGCSVALSTVRGRSTLPSACAASPYVWLLCLGQFFWSAHTRALSPAAQCLSVVSSPVSVWSCDLVLRVTAPELFNQEARRADLRGDTKQVLNDPGLREVARPCHRQRKFGEPRHVVVTPSSTTIGQSVLPTSV